MENIKSDLTHIEYFMLNSLRKSCFKLSNSELKVEYFTHSVTLSPRLNGSVSF